MLIEFEDCKQELSLFLLELIKNVDVSKFPNDNSEELKRYICVCLRNKFIELSKKKQSEYNNRFLTNEEADEKNPIENIYIQPDIQKNIEFEIIKSVELEETLNRLSPKQKM